MNGSKTPVYTITKAIAIAIVITVLTVAGYVAFVKGPSDLVNNGWDTAKRIGNDIDKVVNFRPKITTGGITVVEASKEIVEISLIEKAFEHTFHWEGIWFWSIKRLKLKGHFIAKAGYDLTKPFSIDISEDGKFIRITMPPAKLNSVEQTSIEVLQDENGIWNKITPQERQDAMNALLADAKKALDETSLLSDVDAALMMFLEGAIRKNAPSASIVRDPSPLP